MNRPIQQAIKWCERENEMAGRNNDKLAEQMVYKRMIDFLRKLLPLEEAMTKEVWEAGRAREYAKHFKKIPHDAPDFNQFIEQYNKK